jgi:simple sugar transport system permease protein
MAETVLPDAPTPETTVSREKPERFWSLLGRLLVQQREASVFIVVIVLVVYFSLSNANFLALDNMRNIADIAAGTSIVAVGEVFLLICGEIDLSVGAVVAMAPFVMYNLNQVGVPIWIGVIVALLASLLVGAVNAVATVWFKIPSLISTLGTQFLAQGIMLTISNGADVTPPSQGWLIQVMGAAPFSEMIWAVIVAIIFQAVLSFTRWGIHTIAAGGNLLGASEAGVNVNLIKIGNFLLTGFLGGLVGIMEGFRINSIDTGSGGTVLMFNAVAGAVIGGTALAGGIGTVAGAFLGVLALSILNDGYTLMGVSAFTYYIILGVAILAAMILNQRLSIWREGRR